MSKISNTIKNIRRIHKIKECGRSKCEVCDKYVRNLHQINFTESGILLCKSCYGKELNNYNKCK